ncbi:MAG: transcription antitermination factor NusB [Bacteroidales bacterium]|jgi:N utilization substance protein B|nr:transcription antitermination factor NusB [Bacteroidales bacterium]MDD3273316.1 transcription antitermination factor NusB [Bacteroidales bacterium]
MINRRLIRVKVFKSLFGRVSSDTFSLTGAESELLSSCEKSLELYYFILSLPVAVRRAAQVKIENGLKKFHPTEEERNPNMRFAENRAIQILEDNNELIEFCDKRSLRWNDLQSLVKKILSSLTSSEYYTEYMESSESSFESDLAFLIKFFEEELEENEDLHAILEDMSLFWIDDLEYVINVIIKRLSSLKEGSKLRHPSLFMKDDDREYAVKLLEKSMLNYSKYVELMSGYLKNWDIERLAITDTALIVMGIAEAVEFHDIPIKVTINEYVELSKFFSTPNSKVFVNGILDKVIAGLIAEGKVEKRGRGLVGSAE